MVCYEREPDIQLNAVATYTINNANQEQYSNPYNVVRFIIVLCI